MDPYKEAFHAFQTLQTPSLLCAMISPAQCRPKLAASKAGPIVMAVGGGLVLIGSFKPWATVTSIFGTVSVAGTQGDGKITLVFGLIIVVLAILELTGRPSLARQQAIVGEWAAHAPRPGACTTRPDRPPEHGGSPPGQVPGSVDDPAEPYPQSRTAMLDAATTLWASASGKRGLSADRSHVGGASPRRLDP